MLLEGQEANEIFQGYHMKLRHMKAEARHQRKPQTKTIFKNRL